MTDPVPPARSLLDIVLEQTQAGEHNVVVFRIDDGDFAELAEEGIARAIDVSRREAGWEA